MMHLIIPYNQHYEFDWLERCALCRPRPCDNEPRLSAPAVSSTGGCQKMDGCSTVVQKMKLLLYTLDPWTSSNSFSFCLVDNFWSTPRSSVLQGSFSEEFFRLGRPCCFYLFLLIFNKKIPTRSTVLLVSSTKCCLRHLDSASARENRDTVFCQVNFFHHSNIWELLCNHCNVLCQLNNALFNWQRVPEKMWCRKKSRNRSRSDFWVLSRTGAFASQLYFADVECWMLNAKC